MKHCALRHLFGHKDGALFKTRAILSSKLAAILHIILYQLTKPEAPGYNNFRDILLAIFAKGDNSKIII